jgi:hypothetical protein
MIREMAMLGALVLLQSGGAVTGPVGFAQDTVIEHRIAGEASAEVSSPDLKRHDEVDVRVTIGLDGLVTDAQVAQRGSIGAKDAAPALAAARRLRFRPFAYRGNPVTAVGTLPIRYVAKGEGGWRDPEAALPPIDYTHLKITLIRSACFGSCPDYRVTIDGDGNVVFTTEGDSVPGASEVHRAYSMSTGVVAGGTHRTRIDRAALDTLIERFRAAHFFGLRPEYRAGVTDNPTFVVRFESADKRWEVEDYVGDWVGMPPAVSALEDAIDAAAGTAQWINGDARTVPALIAEGLDPKSDDAARLALGSLLTYRANGRVAADLIAAGLPLDRQVEWPAGNSTTLDAALRDMMTRQVQPQVFAALALRGWPQGLSRDELDSLFVRSGGGCDVAVAQGMIAAGARINAVLKLSEGGDYRDTALQNAVAPYGPCSFLTDRSAYASALIALGADPNLRDNLGRTAIFGVGDADLLERLLASGARADVTGNDTRSAVFSASSDAIILRLLEAGADPNGRFRDPYGRPDHSGETLRQMASGGDMPGTLAWLDAHGVK